MEKINLSNEDLEKYLEIKSKTLLTSDDINFLQKIEKMIPFLVLEILDNRKKECTNES